MKKKELLRLGAMLVCLIGSFSPAFYGCACVDAQKAQVATLFAQIKLQSVGALDEQKEHEIKRLLIDYCAVRAEIITTRQILHDTITKNSGDLIARMWLSKLELKAVLDTYNKEAKKPFFVTLFARGTRLARTEH